MQQYHNSRVWATARMVPFFLFLIIGETSAQGGFDSLARSFDSVESDFQRAGIIESMAAVHNKSSLDFIESRLTDSALVIRIACIKGLALFGGQKAERALEKRWKQVSVTDSARNDFADAVYEKAFIAAALAKLGDQGHLDFVYDHLSDADKAIRFNLVFALGFVGGQEAINKLVDLLITDNQMVSYGALLQLIKLRHLDSNPQTARTIKNRSSYLLQHYRE